MTPLSLMEKIVFGSAISIGLLGMLWAYVNDADALPRPSSPVSIVRCNHG